MGHCLRHPDSIHSSRYNATSVPRPLSTGSCHAEYGPGRRSGSPPPPSKHLARQSHGVSDPVWEAPAPGYGQHNRAGSPADPQRKHPDDRCSDGPGPWGWAIRAGNPPHAAPVLHSRAAQTDKPFSPKSPETQRQPKGPRSPSRARLLMPLVTIPPGSEAAATIWPPGQTQKV